MTAARWACWIALVVGAQITRAYILFKLEIHNQAFGLKLQLTSVCVIMFLGVYVGVARILWATLDQCPETETPSMKVMLMLNLACCLVFATSLLEHRRLNHVQVAPPTLGPTVARADSEKLLARLTLQTFTQEAESNRTHQAGGCVICLSGTYGPGELATELHCHHTFHASCIESWILHGGRGCPLRCEPHPIIVNECEV